MRLVLSAVAMMKSRYAIWVHGRGHKQALYSMGGGAQAQDGAETCSTQGTSAMLMHLQLSDVKPCKCCYMQLDMLPKYCPHDYITHYALLCSCALLRVPARGAGADVLGPSPAASLPSDSPASSSHCLGSTWSENISGSLPSAAWHTNR